MTRLNTPIRVTAGVLGASWLLISLLGCGAVTSVAPDSAARPLVAAEKDARIEVDPERTNVNAVYVTRVVAPVDGLLVVTATDPRDGAEVQVGAQAVPRGETTDVQIPLADVASKAVTVTLLADKARKGFYETDMGDGSPSPDRPVYAGGHPVAVSAVLNQDGVNVRPGAAVLDVYDQKRTNTVALTHVVAPGPSWVVVYADEAGKPGRVLGKSSLAATDAIDVVVPLGSVPATGGVFVALLADRGKTGVFEYGSFDPASTSPDRPYVAGGAELVRRIALQ
jgi:hypothetical protein